MKRYKLLRKDSIIEILDTKNHDKHLLFPVNKLSNYQQNIDFSIEIVAALNLASELKSINNKMDRIKFIETINNCKDITEVNPKNIQECS